MLSVSFVAFQMFALFVSLFVQYYFTPLFTYPKYRMAYDETTAL